MGRPAGTKYIETPERMWQLFCDYRTSIKENPILKNNFAGKDADEVVMKLARPLTLEGFMNYVEDLDIICTLEHYFANVDGRYKDYVGICSRIKRTIRQDQIEGGMAGIFNTSITQRLNNLVEKTQTEIIEQPLFKLD